jgi:cell shape-determining protein MreC
VQFFKNQNRGTEGVAQAVEQLLCKNETLSSNLSSTKKKKKKKPKLTKVINLEYLVL